MRTSYNDYDGVLSRSFKKEQDKKLSNRIKNAKSLINNNCPQSYNIFRKLHNRAIVNSTLSKKYIYVIFIRQKLFFKKRKYDYIQKIGKH